MENNGILYLKSYLFKGATYPVGSSGSFPVLTKNAPCYTTDRFFTKEEKMSILREELPIVQRIELQTLLALGDTSTLIKTLSAPDKVSEPILYIG